MASNNSPKHKNTVHPVQHLTTTPATTTTTHHKVLKAKVIGDPQALHHVDLVRTPTTARTPTNHNSNANGIPPSQLMAATAPPPTTKTRSTRHKSRMATRRETDSTTHHLLTVRSSSRHINSRLFLTSRDATVRQDRVLRAYCRRRCSLWATNKERMGRRGRGERGLR